MKLMCLWILSQQLLHAYTAWHVGLMYCLMAGNTSLTEAIVFSSFVAIERVIK